MEDKTTGYKINRSRSQSAKRAFGKIFNTNDINK